MKYVLTTPQLVTGWLQSVYYGITIRAGDPKPQPGTPRYLTHRRRIHILVVSAYLLYTIYEADYEIRRSGDFYQDLSIPFSATDREIKSRFRRLAAIHHPDKAGANNGGSISSEGYFVHLKLAQDTLLNPAKRFAYERFGPDMVSWQRCSSIRDYLTNGLQSILPYYGAAAVFMSILGFLGYLEWGKYWRWLTLIILCVFELHTISRPSFPLFADKIVNPILRTFTNHPPYLPFQLIQLARKISITLYIAFSQIGPLLNPPPPTAVPTNANPEIQLRQQLDRLESMAKAADTEATRLMGMEMSPFIGDQEALSGVKGKVKEWLVQNTIRSDPEVRDALGNLLKRRRVDAPAGARGNR
jgi:hypothetical protein